MARTRQHMSRSVGRINISPNGRPAETGFHLTKEGIEEYLTFCRAEGRVVGTLQGYRRGLQRLYNDLPEDKTIRRGTLESWREELLRQGYATNTVNGFLSVGNAYLEYVGHREYQVTTQLKWEGELQPELTRAEYLRLLQTARALGREKVYLLVKLFAATGLTVQELDKVTVESLGMGEIRILANKVEQTLRIPGCLQKELLDYVGRNGYLRGPIFLTREGTPMSRTYVSTLIRQLCADAQVPDEKGNPRCLKRLYQATRSEVEANVALLVERALEQQLEEEQATVGWEE